MHRTGRVIFMQTSMRDNFSEFMSNYKIEIPMTKLKS